MAKSTNAHRQAIYEFRIGLQSINPPIWRRVQVPGNYSFFDLHVTIQDLFKWSDAHLHKFEMVKPKRDTLAILMSGQFEMDEYIGIPDRALENEFKIIPETETRLCDHFDINDANKKKCVYTYNFGSEWKHDILLEHVSLAIPRAVYPRCVAGRRQPPPEHCPSGWSFPGELPFERDDIVFRDPKVVWIDYPFKRF